MLGLWITALATALPTVGRGQEGAAAGAQDRVEPTAAPTTFDYETHLDLNYGPRTVRSSARSLDLYVPKLGSRLGSKGTPGNTPAATPPPRLIVFFHGGSWSAGSHQLYRPLGEALAAMGYAVALPGYRLSPRVQHPVHAEDCASAVAWLRARADQYGFDPDGVVLGGHSAGGHLAALLATAPEFLAAHDLVVSETVAAVVTLSAPFDLRAPVAIFERAFGPDIEVRDDASPLRRDLAGAPPFLVLWAEDDLLGLDMVNRSMVRALARAEVPHIGQKVADRNHTSIASGVAEPGDAVAAQIVGFLRAPPGRDAEAVPPPPVRRPKAR